MENEKNWQNKRRLTRKWYRDEASPNKLENRKRQSQIMPKQPKKFINRDPINNENPNYKYFGTPNIVAWKDNSYVFYKKYRVKQREENPKYILEIRNKEQSKENHNKDREGLIRTVGVNKNSERNLTFRFLLLTKVIDEKGRQGSIFWNSKIAKGNECRARWFTFQRGKLKYFDLHQ